MLSPSTELHSRSSSSCSNRPFLSQLMTQLECSPHRLKDVQSHDLCFPSRRCAPPPICPREMPDVQLLTRVLCCSQTLSGEEHGGSPQSNATCSRSTATEACNLFTVTYSLREGTPENAAEMEALPHWRSMPPTCSVSYFGVGNILKAPCVPVLRLAGHSANERARS